MQVPATDRYSVRFGSFAVDLVSHELRSGCRKISLQEKPFQVLAILLEQPGQLVTREELRHRLWPADTFVDFEHSINTAIKKVREALEDSGEHSRFIETLPRRGYRFIAPVEESEEDRVTTRLISADVSNVVTEAPRYVETRHPSAMLLLASAVILVLIVAAASLWHRHAKGKASAVTAASIAVLPFADLSPTHDQGYLSDGLAEEILNRLTKIPSLKVTARASAFQFKGEHQDSRVVGQKLDVADILEGSVQRDKNRVRVTARLIKVDDGYDLWSDSFDRDLKDIFAVEDDVAKAVTSALQLKLLESRSPTTLTTSGTTNPETYEAFLHARYFAHMQDEESEKKALHYANKAIQFDPNYAPAYALRASIELESGGMAWMDLSEAIEKTRHDTEKAIALDPNLADGYRVLSMIQAWVELNCREAETSLKRASDLAPGDPDNLGRSALLAMCQGRQEKAVELWKQELLLDPLRPDEYLWLAQSLRDLGRYEEARRALAKALDLNPNQISMIHEVGGEVYLAQGRPQEALAEMEKEPPGLFRDLGEALTYHALGRRQESGTALARLISQHSNDGGYQIAQVYAYRGEVDQAFEWLNRACMQHDPGLMWFKTDLKLKSLRNDLRHALLLKKLNLPE
jgi:TolB-like protein/DNA-binding winged helix-turn-helix (wHTH) protein/Tfp pilus assembly protein PilF